jgi:ribosomal protein S18 acetylase RimI-like enzyme
MADPAGERGVVVEVERKAAASDLRIVPANAADREWAALLMAGSEPWTTLRRSLETCREVLDDREFQVFIARLDRERCGFLILDPRGVAGAPYLKSIAIAESARGRGLGSALIRFAEDRVRPHSRYLFMCVSSFNEGARRLYERLGYECVGELKDLALEGASEFLLCKRLK